MARDAESQIAPPESGRATTLEQLRTLARTDSDGREKTVLSIHDRFVARILAPPVAWLAIKLGLSADAVTFCSVIAGLAGAGALATGTLNGNLLSAALLQFSYLLDCADGDIARARGTSSIDGYLRDTLRHYLINPAVFSCLTLSVHAHHPELFVLAAGLAGAVLSTRIVSDLDDRVTLESLIRRLKKGSTGKAPAVNVPQVKNKLLNAVRAKLLPDFAVMNWLTVAACVDYLGREPLLKTYSIVDAVFLFLAGAQVVMKCGGLLLLWRSGVSARVEKLAREIEDERRDRAI